MKKLIVLALVLLLCIGCTVADEEKEITFQGIPWGSSIETVTEWVIQQEEYSLSYDTAEKYLDRYLPMSHNGGYSNMVLSESGKPIDYAEEDAYKKALGCSWTYGGARGELKGYRFAGYDLKLFAYDYSCDGEITGLLSVGVVLEYPNGNDAAFEDLQQKLRAVYGAGDIDDEKTYLKLGANNTAVLLRRKNTPMLIYGVTNAKAILDEIMAKQEVPAVTVDPADMKGL